MGKNTFYDRKRELKSLIEEHKKISTAKLLVLYGRRRVGKTELVKQFLESFEKNRIYFYVDLVEKKGILRSLSQAILEQLNETVSFNEFNDFFEYIDRKSQTEKFTVVIDEFQRFLEIAPEFITMLQNYWDSKLKNNKLLFMIVGSSIGMMQKITESKAGALYGRASKIKISPFSYNDFREMFKDKNEADKIVHYSVFGGTPFYLEKVKKINGNVFKVIEELVLKKNAELYEEPKNLLEYENVRVHSKYNAILSAIAAGKEVLKEIQEFTGINVHVMPAYIARLDNLLDLVDKNDPILGKERLGRYKIRDNFFRFWYRFIFSYQTTLNLGNTKAVLSMIEQDLNSYVGRIFEDIIRELLVLHLNKKIKGVYIDFDDIGSWWDRTGEEIDIIAHGKETIIGEVKWRADPVDVAVVENLIRKARLVNIKGQYRLLIASRNGFTKECISKMDELGVIYLTLSDIEKLFDDANSA